jgi:hypothetical protein
VFSYDSSTESKITSFEKNSKFFEDIKVELLNVSSLNIGNDDKFELWIVSLKNDLDKILNFRVLSFDKRILLLYISSCFLKKKESL